MIPVTSNHIKKAPYYHVAIEDFTGMGNVLEKDFPPLDFFGSEVRMDGDLFSEDEPFVLHLEKYDSYKELVSYLTSTDFIGGLIKAFDKEIEEQIQKSQLLLDPRKLEIVSDTLETRTGSPVKQFDVPKIFPRLDIGFGGKGYGINNGGRGIHTDNRRRLFSCLLYLNSPQNMKGGEHRLYEMTKDYALNIVESYSVKQDLFIASLQSNYAFHDVNPIIEIDGVRKAIYLGITCTSDIWTPIKDKKHSELTQNRHFRSPSFFKRIFKALKPAKS